MSLPIKEVHLMTEMMSGVEHAEDAKPEAGLDGLDEQLVAQVWSPGNPRRERLAEPRR